MSRPFLLLSMPDGRVVRSGRVRIRTGVGMGVVDRRRVPKTSPIHDAIPTPVSQPRTMAEGLLERFLPVTIADGRASTTRRSIPTRAVWALARFWWAEWLKRFVRSACQKSPSVCPQTTMPATISGSIRGLLSVTIWSIGNYLSNTTRPTTNRPIRSHFVSISPVPHLQSATNMFCISNVFKDHAVEYQTEEDPFGALKRDELL